MMSKRQIALVLLIVILFLLLVPLQARINRLRQEKDLVETNIFEATTPSDVWGTLLLAGFRGIAVDILWVRAMNLQQEGKFFELVSLYKLILDLQPHFLPVWTYSAWNMAYNISHDCDTLEEKWTWIQKGISLLERGIKRNPKNWHLYFELGWIYFHKCVAVGAEGYYVKQLENEGKNNFELAVYWFEKATEHPPYPLYIDHLIGHALGERAKQAKEAGKAENFVEFKRRALLKWEENMKKYPDSEITRQNYLHWKSRLSGENP